MVSPRVGRVQQERAAARIDFRAFRDDSKPAIYAYHQTYDLAGKTLTRKHFFARLRLEPLGQGKVFSA